jgi:hypothetical protein
MSKVGPEALFTNLTPLIPLSFLRERGKIEKEGLTPLLDAP